MKKIVYSVLGLGLSIPSAYFVQSFSKNVEKMSVNFKDIISSEFKVYGEWSNSDLDRNTPDIFLTKNNNSYSKVYARNIKNNSFNQKNYSQIEFNINFKNLGGSYDIAKLQYDLNVLSNVKLKFTTQAGQPAHNQVAGWEKTVESWDILQIMNYGNSILIDGNNYDWGEWAGLKHNVIATWNYERSNLRIVWRTNEVRVKASKWTDAIYFRIELLNYKIEIPRIA
ncbi:hypothetical protein [Spiroplasma sp. BIUS-1]|uniref:hypothetical protein n=1 Tax=Spiroplasma sp. BIUS-1 TaxID=216964 RepID=UPI0013A6FDF9|nr:hypothetical protein [Spiroplasma sp. BIUS-1]